MLQESIRIAQESNDHVCLTHGLRLLYKLKQEGDSQAKQILERFRIRASELKLRVRRAFHICAPHYFWPRGPKVPISGSKFGFALIQQRVYLDLCSSFNHSALVVPKCFLAAPVSSLPHLILLYFLCQLGPSSLAGQSGSISRASKANYSLMSKYYHIFKSCSLFQCSNAIIVFPC